jgi:hypothetical protein
MLLGILSPNLGPNVHHLGPWLCIESVLIALRQSRCQTGHAQRPWSAECGRDPVAMSVVPIRRSPKIGIYRFHVPRLLGFYAYKIKQLQIRTQPACCLTHVILKRRPTVKFTGCQGGRASSPIRRFFPTRKRTWFNGDFHGDFTIKNGGLIGVYHRKW